MPRRVDRTNFFSENNLRRFPKLKFIRVDGFDPIWHRLRSTGCSETDGHACCWLSHYMSWQVALATGSPAAFILEDDVVLADDFDDGMGGLELNSSAPVSLDPDATNGTYAYFASRAALGHMVALCRSRTDHVDNQIWKKFGLTKHHKKMASHQFKAVMSETSAYSSWDG